MTVCASEYRYLAYKYDRTIQIYTRTRMISDDLAGDMISGIIPD